MKKIFFLLAIIFITSTASAINLSVEKIGGQDVMINGIKVSTNKGSVEMKIAGTLSRDYKGKFETTAFRKFLREIYEKWIIPSRIDEFQGKIAMECDEFLSQAKAYLDLEGKKGL